MNKKDYYIEQYKQYHENLNRYPGESIDLDIKFIKPLIECYDAKTILDFGCGKGYQYTKRKIHEKQFFNIMPALYDPGVPEYSKLPDGPFHGVITCDVLEHVPEEAMDEVLTQIFSRAERFVFIAVCDIPAFAILPDGQNAHVTQKPCVWWIEKIKPFTNTVFCKFAIRGNDRFVCEMVNNQLLSMKPL